MSCFHWSIFGPFSWTILGPCWCLSLISWLSRYHRYLNHRVLDILQDQANSKRSVGLLSLSLSVSVCLSLTRTDATRWLPNMQIHGDLHWRDQQQDCMSSNRRHHIESDLSKIRVQPRAMSSHVKPQVNLIRSGMVRRIVAWLQRWCVRYALALHWLDVIKSNWIPGHRFLCWFLMRNGDWKRLRNLESGSPRGTWACHSLPTVLLISFRRCRGICFVKGDALLQFANSEGLTFTERSKSQKCRRAT